MIELRLPLSRRLSAINPPRLYIARLSFIDRINNEIASGSPDFLSREGRRRRRIKREARKGKKGEEIGKERVTTALFDIRFRPAYARSHAENFCLRVYNLFSNATRILSPSPRRMGRRREERERERAKATRYKFPDIRPFVSFEMGQFSRDLMVIAFLGGHIAFHPVQCVRPIYQSSSLSRIRVALGWGAWVWRRSETEEGERERERERERRGARSYRKPLRSSGSSSSSSPLGGRALPDCRREVAEVWPRS